MKKHIHDLGFSFLDQNILQDLMYATTHNFTGVVVEGYTFNRAIGTKEMVEALRKVQIDLTKKGFTLLVKDAYRPHRAVHFFNTIWKNMPDDLKMKRYYYPDLQKTELFENGYLAKHYSRHSSGSTVDLTLVDINTNKELDMGSPVDFLGAASHLAFTELTELQQKNRSVLTRVMQENGFKGVSTEWWHFSLINEPFCNQAFDFTYDDDGWIINGNTEPIYWQ